MNGSTSSSATPAPAPRLAEPGIAAERPARFTLTGPSRPFDPVHQAIRGDLADIAEAAHHFAPHYAEPVMCRAIVAGTVRAAPGDGADARADLPRGAGFALLDLSGGWAWGYAVEGHVVGYVPRGDIDIA